MEPQGTMDSQNLIEVLLTIGRLRRTGILTVQGDDQIIGLTFREGEIVATDALNETLEDGLGAVLASRNLVSAEDFASMVAEHDAGGGQVSDLLLERAYIDRSQLMSALEWHNYLLCRQVLSWGDCAYKFYEGSEVAGEEGLRPLPVEEVLVRAAEDLGDLGPLPGTMPGLDGVYRATGTVGVEAGRSELLIGLATGDSDGAISLLQQIDGEQTIGEVASNAGLAENEARLAIYLLERAGRIEPVPGTGPDHQIGPAGRAMASVANGAGAAARAGARWFGGGGQSQAARELSRLEDIDWQIWPARILGLGLALILLVLAWTGPARVLLPFPWQEGQRQAAFDVQTSAAYLKIDRAAKTSFLLDGHFPESLDELVQEAYLTHADLSDPAGRPLGYSAQVASYLIYPSGKEELVPGASRTEAVTGNFLLDPEFLQSEAVERPPLVLLD